ncbi:DUF6452 family protein [Tenacibaculum sp. UWU-22]|uniref:DUF6452 family protein n=1 Tax=Tenacibaculum sp. UWU-22 TaxID=3234187 RepID=UPI0034DB2CA7
MKKLVYGLLLLVCFNWGCDIDDICTEPITPKLILRFYDATDTSVVKKAERLSVIAASKTDSLFTSQSTDSIALPLNTNTTQTVYKLKTNTVSGNIADNKINTLTITYQTKDIYVSRSCGYKTIFNNVTITSDNGWFTSFTPNTLTTINNETAAHVKVYH